MRATDLAGRVTTVTRNVGVAITTANPPDTAITAGPSNPTAATNATFTFSATPGERGIGGFACSLDGGPFITCSSPTVYSGLSKGAHSFRVRAIDTQGFVDLSPASFTWTVADQPPPPPPAPPKLYLPLVRR